MCLRWVQQEVRSGLKVRVAAQGRQDSSAGEGGQLLDIPGGEWGRRGRVMWSGQRGSKGSCR